MQLVKAFFIHTHGAHCNHYYAFTIVKSIDNKSHNQLRITIYAFALKKNKNSRLHWSSPTQNESQNNFV